MKILKFGGTSVANAQNIKLVLDIVQNILDINALISLLLFLTTF